MWIAGDGVEREDICLCFRYFEQFQKDFPALSDKGVIKRIAFDQYEWTESETSLAEYFYWVGEQERKKIEKNQLNIPGGFWAPIEKVFRINRTILSNMASRARNSNPLKRGEGETEVFKEIKKIVEEYRENVKKQEEQDQKDRETFTAIKTIIGNANGEDMKEIRTVLEKIKFVM